jgi:hypothetical protein
MNKYKFLTQKRILDEAYERFGEHIEMEEDGNAILINGLLRMIEEERCNVDTYKMLVRRLEARLHEKELCKSA